MKDLFSNDFESNEQQKVQNSLPTRAPAFCNRPFWYVNGGEKKVKIGKESFNYIDYLEAWCGMDCGTYRSRDTLYSLEKRIEKAFMEIENA